MDIKKVSGYSDQKLPMVQETELKAAEQTRAQTSKSNTAGEKSDRVELSKGYQEVDKLRKVVMEMSDVRMERVDHIRNMIQRGTYQVDPDKVAGKILDDLA